MRETSKIQIIQIIDIGSFSYSYIEYVKFPSSVKEIGKYAFSENEGLRIDFQNDSKLEKK